MWWGREFFQTIIYHIFSNVKGLMSQTWVGEVEEDGIPLTLILVVCLTICIIIPLATLATQGLYRRKGICRSLDLNSQSNSRTKSYYTARLSLRWHPQR